MNAFIDLFNYRDDTGISYSIGINNRSRVIRTSVVNNNELKIRERLIENAIDASGKELSIVIG